MDDSSTESQISVFPSFKNFELKEVPWWILCCRVYARSFNWRQIPAQIRLEEVERKQGNRPDPPVYPPEPVFTGDPIRSAEVREFKREHEEWNTEVQIMSRKYQNEVMFWENQGMKAAQKWDLSPVPELAPFDSRPPELREWIPVQVLEGKIMRSRQASRVPTTTRSMQQGEDGKWGETLTQGTTWKPYAIDKLRQMLEHEPCIHVPETLVLAVPGESFRRFLAQVERGVLALVRCRWDPADKQLVHLGAFPLTFTLPAVEIVASVAISELGTLPVTKWPGVPDDLWEGLEGWGSGQQVPATRAQFAALEHWISEQPDLPRWYVAPEYRSLVAVNLCCGEASETWGEDYLWRPLLDGSPGGDSGDLDWVPSM